MANMEINGHQLEMMLKNGLANIILHQQEINQLNVFPVADGDTGTNMMLTMRHGVNCANSSRFIGSYLKQVSDGMLLGARGNSGVILSQFFKGLFTCLSRARSINANDLKEGLISAYQCAYKAVNRPVEGTILTVFREGIESIKSQIDRNTSIEQLLSMYIAKMQVVLKETPEMLTILKQSNVIDSGGLGFIIIVQGMLKALYGEIIDVDEEQQQEQQQEIDYSLFNKDSIFEDGYCMEFILQLMNNKKYQRFNVDRFIDDLNDLGTSLVCVKDDSRVKVHVHTFKPARIITLAQEYGEFLTFKLDNMQLQHFETTKKKALNNAFKPLGIIAVTNCEQCNQLFEKLGCDIIISNHESMNVSTNEFIDAINSLNCQQVVILPNNPNTILSAKQAASMVNKKVTIVESKSILEGYYCLMLDVADSQDCDYRVKQINSGLGCLQEIAIARASKNYTNEKVSCVINDEIAIIDDEIVASGKGDFEVALKALKSIDGIDFMDNCMIIRGIGVSNLKEEALKAKINEIYPDLNVTFLDGVVAIYHWIIGVN